MDLLLILCDNSELSTVLASYVFIGCCQTSKIFEKNRNKIGNFAATIGNFSAKIVKIENFTAKTVKIVNFTERRHKYHKFLKKNGRNFEFLRNICLRLRNF